VSLGKSVSDFAKTTADLTFTFAASETKCDDAKWASASACEGFNGQWGANDNTWAKDTTGGTHRYYHWLADASTATDIFSIEDKAVVNVLVIEAHADVYSTTANENAKSCSTLSRNGKTYYATATATYAKNSNGATSTILGASALIAGVLASLF
jgi:hypothetical protein